MYVWKGGYVHRLRYRTCILDCKTRVDDFYFAII